MRVYGNIPGLSSSYTIDQSSFGLSKTPSKTDNGQATQNVVDDKSGLNISNPLSEKFKDMIGVQENISSAKDLLSTAENSLLGVNDLLNKIGVKLKDSSDPAADTSAIKDNIASLANEIDSKIKGAEFNKASLLHSTSGKTFVFKVGENVDTLKLDFASTIASTGNGGYNKNFSDGLASLVNVSTSNLSRTSGNTEASDRLTSAFKSLTGAVGSALGKVSDYKQSLDIIDESVISSISNEKVGSGKINDSDEAFIQLNFMKESIQQKTATAMIAQVNTAPQQIYNLFGG